MNEEKQKKIYHLTAKEWRWAFGWSVVILILSCVPYIVANNATPIGWQFNGLLVNPTDGYSYLAKMRQGSAGNWLFHLTYTPEPHAGAFIFTFYLTLGHLSALFNVSPILMFHLVRLGTSLWLLLVLFRFITHITPKVNEQRLAFILLISSSGLGWLGILLFNITPIDIWVPEGFIPYTIFSNPHFCLGLVLMLGIIQKIVWWQQGKYAIFWIGVSALCLALIQPFALLTVWVIIAVFLSWQLIIWRNIPKKQLILVSTTLFSSAPIIIYDYMVTKVNPTMAGWSTQNITTVPSIMELVFGYGVLGLLAVLGVWVVVYPIIKQMLNNYKTTQLNLKDIFIHANKGEWLLLLWFLVTLASIYLPFALQRRLINGLHIPIGILAALGIKRWLQQWLFSKNINFRKQQLIIAGVVATGIVGTVFVWSISMMVALQSPEQSELAAILFMRNEEKVAFEWINDNLVEGEVLLASPRVGLLTPAYTKLRPFYGHVYETLNASARKATAEAFYEGNFDLPPAEVDYIFYGPSERLLGQPKNLAGFEVIYSSDTVEIYKVSEQ